jgi:D-alanyl-D-alanine carboxypeptidase
MVPAALLAASLALTQAQITKIDAVVAQVMQSNHIPGLSLGVARKGHVLFLRGYGTRDCSADARADGYTVYRVGSITKQFTAVLVLEAADRGQLPLDAQIDGITIEQLLAQTSGLVNYTDPGETLDAAMNAPLQFTPGTQWQYSNSNYYLLGTALENVTKLKYADLLAQRITQPLGLTSTTFAPPLERNVARACVPQGTNDEPALAFSASALSSNVPDSLAWLSALYDGEVLNDDRFDQMTTSGTLANGSPTHYGFGFFTDSWYGLRIAQTPGNIDGFSAEDGLVLDDGTSFAILTNADRVPLVPLAKSIVEIVEPLKNPALVASLGHPGVFEDPAVTALVRTVIAQLSTGRIDRDLLTDDLDASLGASRLRAFAATLRPLGRLKESLFNESTAIDNSASEVYTLNFERGRLTLTMQLRGGRIDSLELDPSR